MNQDRPIRDELADPRWAGRVFIVSGPSGVGKSVLIQRVLDGAPSLTRAVTATTRPPSPREKDGTDYYFVSTEQFQEWIRRGELLEYVEFCGNYYGTPASSVLGPLKAGRRVVLVIDVEGALKVKDLMPGAVSVFIVPPSIEELRRRLQGRGRDEREAVERRLARAREELGFKDRYDHVVVNDRIETAVADLRRIIAPV